MHTEKMSHNPNLPPRSDRAVALEKAWELYSSGKISLAELLEADRLVNGNIGILLPKNTQK